MPSVPRPLFGSLRVWPPQPTKVELFINLKTAKAIGLIGSVAHQAAGRDELAQKVNSGNRMARRQRNELVAPTDEEGIGTDDDGACPQLGEGRIRYVDLAFSAGIHDTDFPLEGARRRLHVSRNVRGNIRIGRI